MPKLSIIVIVYNVESYILPCFESIFNQGIDDNDYEVIIVNDGCTDNSMEHEYRSAGLDVTHVTSDLATITTIVQHAKSIYDLVICNTICTYKWVRAFQKVGLPTIWFIRETVLVDKWAVENTEFCNLLKRFYNIYCPAEYTASQIRFYNKNVRVVRNATPDLFSGYLPPADVIRYGYIGSKYNSG